MHAVLRFERGDPAWCGAGPAGCGAGPAAAPALAGGGNGAPAYAFLIAARGCGQTGWRCPRQRRAHVCTAAVAPASAPRRARAPRGSRRAAPGAPAEAHSAKRGAAAAAGRARATSRGGRAEQGGCCPAEAAAAPAVRMFTCSGGRHALERHACRHGIRAASRSAQQWCVQEARCVVGYEYVRGHARARGRAGATVG